MKPLGFIGKIIYAIPLLVFGFGHLTNAGSMKGMVPSMFPFPEIWVYLTGIALILAAISIIINKKTRLATLLLGIMLLLFAVLIHLPAMLDGSQAGFASFMKDSAMAGAAFFISTNSKN
jgi:uncharacterized membrane protein YphA (DoxX/SURF4 family)